MDTVFVADTSAVIRMTVGVSEANKVRLFDALTTMVEKGTFCFPRAVVNDLSVRARGEEILSWCQGQGNRLRSFAADIEHLMWLMQRLQEQFGFEEGVEDIDGGQPSIVAVAAYVRQLVAGQRSVLVVSEDIGSVPLRPTMQQLCEAFDWPMCSVGTFLDQSGISSLFN